MSGAARGGEASADAHPFVARPHRTLLGLSVPVMLSLLAEPLTGVADTAFVARLGSAQAAALGIATALLSSGVWVFNFLGIGTQTEVARADGVGDRAEAREAATRALLLGVAIGAALAAAAFPFVEAAARWMGADGAVRGGTSAYLRVRLLGIPAMLALLVAFGALRGVQDMRTPLRLAVGVNAANIALDAVLIFGLGPAPRLGLAGAAWATTGSQWVGALLALHALRRRLGPPGRLRARGLRGLVRVGRDMVLRTGALLLFLLLATRVANRAGAEPGAAHQGIRQVWMLTAFLLDAFALSAQSLVGYFLGARRRVQARRVARVACGWALGTGALLASSLAMAEGAVAALLVPPDAREAFAAAWPVAVLALPANALSFATDGLHWGAGDFRYLRNAMLLATGAGALALAAIDPGAPGALVQVWLATGLWILLRAALGLVRIFPGVGRAPLAAAGEAAPALR